MIHGNDFISLIEQLLRDGKCQTKNTKQFRNQAEKQELISLSVDLAKHLHSNKFDAVFFVDNGARPAAKGMREAWKKLYPGQKMPKISFINPYGFLTENYKAHLHTKGDHEQIFQTAWKADRVIQRDEMDPPSFSNLESIASQKRVNKEMESLLKKQGLTKDSKIMVFDTCMHSGTTIRPLLYTLKNVMKFKNIIFGLASSADPSGSHREPGMVNFSCTSDHPKKSCEPYGAHNVTRKRLDSIHCKANGLQDGSRLKNIRDYRKLQEEIKSVIDDGFQKISK